MNEGPRGGRLMGRRRQVTLQPEGNARTQPVPGPWQSPPERAVPNAVPPEAMGANLERHGARLAFSSAGSNMSEGSRPVMGKCRFRVQPGVPLDHFPWGRSASVKSENPLPTTTIWKTRCRCTGKSIPQMMAGSCRARPFPCRTRPTPKRSSNGQTPSGKGGRVQACGQIFGFVKKVLTCDVRGPGGEMGHAGWRRWSWRVGAG